MAAPPAVPAPAAAAPPTPAALPFTTGPDCHDRAYQTNRTTPCSDRPGHSHWRKHYCTHINTYHDRNYRVCGACSDNTDAQPWAQQGHIDIMQIGFPGNNPFTPPAPGAAGGFPWPAGTKGTWTGFLTRLCKQCECLEQQKLWEFVNQTPGQYYRNWRRNNTPTYADWREPGDFPRNKCTCLFKLGTTGPAPGLGGLEDPRMCIRHRMRRWNNIIANRDRNDRWLRSIAIDKNTQELCTASPRRLSSRDCKSTQAYRACRCGSEVETPIQPASAVAGGAEVWQCMGCENLVHVVDPGGPSSQYQGPYDVDNLRETAERACKKSRSRGDVSLRREKLERKV
ncbi:hypothetical protein CLAFUW4_03715 [Fulvia fulva]|uniref:Uncharacterized protein n=1 Tax=Passalora fulva TaxID=5499 RepID=A0A9Q8LAT7_PASFU|nr:uncharacterized protein CLAFUR5_03690 [Fulvia fulva]UJO13854.1 hypothetical protein CLAFUR5_03690 [Fulvia fulva]WPV11672.1 hypothetical protein CLAFUW4_03715 [Fulvia fulva]